MATINYKQLSTPEANLIELLSAQNQDGTYSAKLMGSEPFSVLAAKTIYNTYNDIESNMAADVEGPASSTDNALARFDGTTGKLIQNSNAILTDAGALSLASNLTVSGTSALNGTVNTNGARAVNVTPTMTPLSGNLYGLYVQPTINSGASAGGTVSGLTVAATNSGTSNVTNIAGIEFIGGNGAASGSMQDLKAFRSSPINLSTGQIVNLYQFYATNAYNPSGTINTQYGLYVDALTSATTNYAIYTAGTAPSRLGGNLTVNGNVYGGSNLVLYGTTGATGNVYLRAQGAGYVRVDTGSGFRVESGSLDVTAGNLTVSGGQATTIGSSANYSLWKDGTPTKAGRLILNTNVTNGLSLGLYNGSSWVDTLHIHPTNNNVLIGTNIDSGNGKLQLADHTTSAGGIGFGATTSLYRYGITTLGLKQNSGSYKPLFFYADVTNCGVFDTPAAEPNYSGIYFNSTANSATIATKGTVALTLDSSQNATFAGRSSATTAYGTAKSVTVDFATSTATNVTRTFTVTIPSPGLAGTFLLEVGVYGNGATGLGSLLVKGYGYFGSTSLYDATEISKVSTGNVTVSSITKGNGSFTFTVLDTTSSALVAVKYSQTSDAAITTLPTITSA